ncbi:MAG: hypothetical protein EA416_06320 [Trueperaceae bacterium]|nr:MAG: hypothetical protein EA416_06320 [Trueperaceae bacterium]
MLDTLEALGEHRRSIVVIGAHAIYMQVAPTNVALAPFTSDTDLAIDPRGLADELTLDDVMRSAGFTLDDDLEPGMWHRTLEGGTDEIDLMVPATMSGPGRRAARIPPHGDRVARKANGLEGVLVDNDVLDIPSLAPSRDARTFRVRVAGPAALLVAKLFKLRERVSAGTPGRLFDKDAHDVYRLLIGCEAVDLRTRYLRLLTQDISRTVANTAMNDLQALFAAGPRAPGSAMAGRAEEGVGAPATVSLQAALLAEELLKSLSPRHTQ